jgi:hypothetical protein
VVLFAVVAVMVSKPYPGETATLVGLGIGIAVTWLLLAWASRPRASRLASRAQVPSVGR